MTVFWSPGSRAPGNRLTPPGTHWDAGSSFMGLHKPAEIAFLGKKLRWAPAQGVSSALAKPSVLWVMPPSPPPEWKIQLDCDTGDFNAVTHTARQTQALQSRAKKRRKFANLARFLHICEMGLVSCRVGDNECDHVRTSPSFLLFCTFFR